MRISTRQKPKSTGQTPGPRMISPPIDLTRRNLLKTGLLGSLMLSCLGVVGAAGRLTAAEISTGTGMRFFLPKEIPLLKALVPAVLQGCLEDQTEDAEKLAESILHEADSVFAALSPAVQAEVHEALFLLRIPPVRILAGGMWPDWDEAGTADVSGLLDSLRQSRLGLLRSLYLLLRSIPAVGWYAQPQAWAAIGYPGPPEISRPAGEGLI